MTFMQDVPFGIWLFWWAGLSFLLVEIINWVIGRRTDGTQED